MARLTYYKTDLIVSVNKFNQKWEMFYGADEDKLAIIYNGIDVNKFKPRPKPEHLQGVPTVVAAARIFELKDILTMIRSCAVVAREIPNVQYLIYGNKTVVPEYTAECEALIRKFSIEKNFKLLGTRSEPELIYPEGDISILTSVSEGFPYTVLESMACGIPVIATDVGGIAEAMDDSCGVFCKPKDAESIGEAVIKLLKNKGLRESMGAIAHQRVLNNFAIDHFVEAYEELYQKVIIEKEGSLILKAN